MGLSIFWGNLNLPHIALHIFYIPLVSALISFISPLYLSYIALHPPYINIYPPELLTSPLSPPSPPRNSPLSPLFFSPSLTSNLCLVLTSLVGLSDKRLITD